MKRKRGARTKSRRKYPALLQLSCGVDFVFAADPEEEEDADAQDEEDGEEEEEPEAQDEESTDEEDDDASAQDEEDDDDADAQDGEDEDEDADAQDGDEEDEETQASALPTFQMVAYDGRPMRVFAWSDPVVIDYAGLQLRDSIPIRLGHDPSRLVGHTDSVGVDSNNLSASGVVSFENAHAQEVVAAARNGFPWQASVGVQPTKVEFFAEGEVARVNGNEVEGPVDVIRAGTLKEISFVDLGASSGTRVSVAASASEGTRMPVSKKTAASPVASIRAEAAAETRRIAAIQKVAAKHPKIAAKAIEKGWSAEKAELEVLRAARPAAPTTGGSAGPIEAEVLEAAICAAGRLPNLDKRFSERALDAADKRYRGRIGLQEVIVEAAQANGWNGRSLRADMRGALQAAFSTFSLPGILSNNANKFLLEGFNAVEATWRDITAVRPVTDFKQVTSYRLDGGFEYEEVGGDGELKHATTGETSYTNQARTYGKMYAVTRTDIINDDLGALTQIPQRIGRGAALKLNKVFWTAFMDNSTFFTSANGSYFEGAATNLQISSLTTALQKFRDQTDPDGNPLAIAPAILLVPTALEVTAAELMNSTEVRNPGATSKFGTTNPFAGMFRPLVSAYLSNSTITGNSSTAWYLLADPQDLAVIEVAVLNGAMEPTVETAEADFSVLGIQMRGYHDFGVSKQEYRGGVKSKGAA